MNGVTCTQLHELAPELALGTLPGRQRAIALDHLDRCADCRWTVEELSDAADALLLAAPEADPGDGFAARVAEGFSVRRPSRFVGVARVAAIAAAVVAIAIAGVTGIPGHGRAPSTHLFALQASGVRMTHFVPVAGEEVQGEVFADANRPASVFMTVRDDGGDDTYRCQVETGDGRWIDVGSFRLHDGAGSWGGTVADDLGQARAFRLLDDHGSVAATASLS